MSQILQTLKSFTQVTAGAGELLFFNTWFLSIPANDASQPRAIKEMLMHQALHCAIYAFTEPLYTSLFLSTGLEPFIFVLASSAFHSLMSLAFTHAVSILSTSPHTRPISGTGTPHRIDKVESDVLRSNPPRPGSSPSNTDIDAQKAYHDHVCSVFEHTHVQTSAACNASILLLGQRSSVESEEHSPSVVMWLSAFSLAFFFASRMVDLNLASLTGRSIFSQFFSRASIVNAAALLAFTITLRAMMRRVLGMGVLGLLEQDAAIQDRFLPGRDGWWRQAVEGMPKWLPFALSALAVGMMGLSRVFIAKANREL